MIPEGHEPTREDIDILGYANTPQGMRAQLDREEFGIACTYTHYSREETVGPRWGFKRRFSRGAYDPFSAQYPMAVDDTAHTVLEMGIM